MCVCLAVYSHWSFHLFVSLVAHSHWAFHLSVSLAFYSHFIFHLSVSPAANFHSSLSSVHQFGSFLPLSLSFDAGWHILLVFVYQFVQMDFHALNINVVSLSHS